LAPVHGVRLWFCNTEFCYSTQEVSKWRCHRHEYRFESMMASILAKLDGLGDQHPHRLLYSYIDLNGNQIGGSSSESFLRRTKGFPEHRGKERGSGRQT